MAQEINYPDSEITVCAFKKRKPPVRYKYSFYAGYVTVQAVTQLVANLEEAVFIEDVTQMTITPSISDLMKQAKYNESFKTK